MRHHPNTVSNDQVLEGPMECFCPAYEELLLLLLRLGPLRCRNLTITRSIKELSTRPLYRKQAFCTICIYPTQTSEASLRPYTAIKIRRLLHALHISIMPQAKQQATTYNCYPSHNTSNLRMLTKIPGPPQDYTSTILPITPS